MASNTSFILDSRFLSADKIISAQPERITRELNKILRITRLAQNLSKDPTEQEKFRQIWVDSLTDLKEGKVPEAVKGQILARLGESVSWIYEPELESLERFEDKIRKFAKDLLKITSHPVKKSDRGNKGPTLLVSYPSASSMRAYVLKFSHLNELISNRVYELFGRCLDLTKSFSPGFIVPCSARLSLGDNIHESPMRAVHPLSEETSALMRSQLTEIASCVSYKRPKETNHILLSERVVGQNLIDFAYTKYNDLTSEQKDKFFERLGRIAVLDLLMGNLDRIAQVDRMGDGSYQLKDNLEVNLGNVMISQKEGYFQLYAIDNTLDQELIDDPEAKAAYLRFLNELFRQANPAKNIANNILQCFKNSLAAQTDDIDTSQESFNLADVRRALEPLQSDLDAIAPQFLELGINSMINWLNETALPKIWVSTEGDSLKSYLVSQYPEYLDAIEERFKAFRGEP